MLDMMTTMSMKDMSIIDAMKIERAMNMYKIRAYLR